MSDPYVDKFDFQKPPRHQFASTANQKHLISFANLENFNTPNILGSVRVNEFKASSELDLHKISKKGILTNQTESNMSTKRSLDKNSIFEQIGFIYSNIDQYIDVKDQSEEKVNQMMLK